MKRPAKMNLQEYVEAKRSKTIAAYKADPGLVAEHHGIERVMLAGGYGYRQVLELVQNGADAQLEQSKTRRSSKSSHRIEARLCDSRLYVANTGKPLSHKGVDALLSSHRSPKRGNEIGRFSLGFKSLLGLGGRIDVFTRSSGAIRFDPERCRRELKKKFRVPEAPALRLAWPLDDKECDDPLLVEMRWAETIVRAEIRNTDIEQHLREEIRRFPAEFLLFFPADVQIFLNDGTEQPRELRVVRDGDRCVLHDGDSASTWLVARKSDVKITDQRALDDASEIHRREAVPISWAVPLDSTKKDAGTFWAFLPTATQTRLAGILNAPWKLNSDRTAIIRGEWNSALMYEAAKLVAEALPKLSSPYDPGRPLDAFPRQLDRNDEVAAPLVDAVWRELERLEVVPDGTGTKLRRANELRRPPTNNAELARQWEAIARSKEEELAKVVHSSCLEGDRYSRLDALAERLTTQQSKTPDAARLPKLGASEWFECVASNDPGTAKRVLDLAAAFKEDCKPADWEQHRSCLRIIPSIDGHLLTADEAILAHTGVSIPGRTPVANALCEDTDARRILVEVMKVFKPADEFWQNELHERLSRAYSDADWRMFWRLLRMSPEAIRDQFVESNKTRIRVHRRDGSWVAWCSVLLPGRIVAAGDESPNQNVLFNNHTHEGDEPIIEMLGVTDRPSGRVREEDASGILAGWRNECRWRYKYTVKNRASSHYLDPKPFEMPCGWDLLPMLSGRANAELTSHFLTRLNADEFCDEVAFCYSRPGRYEPLDVRNPLAWFILRYGTVLAGDAVIRINTIAARRKEPAVSQVAKWRELLPAIEKVAGLEAPKAPTEEEIRDLWESLFGMLAVSPLLVDGSLRELWSGGAKDGVVPDSLHLECGDVSLEELYVTISPDLAIHASKAGYVAVTLDRETFDLWLEHGAMDLSAHVMPEWADQFEPAHLLDSFPELGAEGVLCDAAAAAARCQPVSRLQLRVGDSLEPLPCLLWEGALVVDNEQLAALSRERRLTLLLEAAGAAGWLQGSAVDALAILGDSQVDERRAKVAEAATLAERLLRAVGARREPLEQALGELRHADFIKECEPLRLAELVLSQLGPAVLADLRGTLHAEGLNPPSRWGSAEAREFVASIGFPDAFAASTQARREAEETISGPIDLGPLHDFQEDVLKSIGDLIASGNGRRRAVVSLPTGAGKTRVTVQAAIELVLKPEGGRRSVLWIAQTGELCEQAVQAFRQVWINRGAKNTDLRIVRLWDSNPNPVSREPGKPVVVVASIQTLNSRMGDDPLAWLQKPGLVVVDECHHGITSSYTRLLHWLDADSTHKESAREDEPPILGLSATPFRTDVDERARLAKRFDSRWFPAGQKELPARLQAEGYLATPECVPLESGVSLLPEEFEQLSRLLEPSPHRDFENIELRNILEAINQRLASSEERNKKLVDYLLECNERSILFFSNSVAHASEISARLNLAGMAAAAVSGETPRASRRYFLGRFQRGEIRVLCNHSVLSTGFDAPKTDLVLIARQVFSPVRYMQMVGRGLRGKANGGKETCRIVTVLDNLGRFENLHPYHYCRPHFGNGQE